MNILPKKRWHVRTKENIARVRRDEAEALAKEKESQRRILLAEQEARANLLRSQVKSSKGDAIEERQPSPVLNKHINFFEELERSGRYTGGVNKEHEAEKKEEQEKYEKNIGLLSYLGQGSTEQTGQTPWYLKSHESRIEEEDEKKEKRKSSSQDFLDPMNDMKKYLKMTFGKEEPKKKGSTQSEESKKEHKRKRQSTENSNNNNLETKKTLLEKMREERLKREKAERAREQQLIDRLSGKIPKTQSRPIAIDERRNRYNSQFNPDLARQNQPRDKIT